MLGVIQQAVRHQDRIAVLTDGQSYTYHQLLESSEAIARALLNGRADLEEARIAFMVMPGFEYVSVMWGIWRAGGIAVPLCLSHPAPALDHVLKDTASEMVVTSGAYAQLITPLCSARNIVVHVLGTLKGSANGLLPSIESYRRAMILYTSGTTNLPKGVVTTHHNIHAQVTTLVNAWQWNTDDHTLCVLPLHHVHGIINVVSCSLWAGARCEFLPAFDADKVIDIFLGGKVNVFMAVPTIYFRLIAAWEQRNAEEQQRITSSLKQMRLMVSGSAALPVSVMERWHQISGHRLLERYGMTEIGMAISNPYAGERRAGYVGIPLEGVEVRLCDEMNQPIVAEPGEIQVRGPNVFLEYWGQPEATAMSFTADGWFRTGDVAVVESDYYRILGRSSVDIIKSGGYKISALEIEEVLRTHPLVADCAVVGIENVEWGEVVAAALVPRDKGVDPASLSGWLKERIPAYRVPRRYLMVSELPRNAMGKVTKGDVKKLFAT